MRRRELTYASLVATSMLWGGAFVAIKQALQYLSPLQLLVMRFLPASLAFAILLGWRHRSALGSMLRRDWLSLSAMGLFGVVVYHSALNTGEQLISAGTASLLMALNPAFIFLLSVFLRQERVTWTRAVGLLLAFAGLVVVVGFGGDGKIQLGMVRGVLITLIAPLAWSVYTLISRPLAARHPPHPGYRERIPRGAAEHDATGRLAQHRLRGFGCDRRWGVDVGDGPGAARGQSSGCFHLPRPALGRPPVTMAARRTADLVPGPWGGADHPGCRPGEPMKRPQRPSWWGRGATMSR
jgi:uncharacterized membrane protein